jgi:D-arabinose 1-dehydrogenase-like Zn-dependent alcohol dehydrogenase
VLGRAVVVADPSEGARAAALAAGAAAAIDPRAPGAARELMKTTGGIAAAFDFVGSGESFELGFSVIGKGGTLVVVGLIGGAATFSPALLPMKSVTVCGSYVGSLAQMEELVALARSGTLPAMPITARPLDEVDAALDDLRGGRVRGRLVVAPSV